jgi:hypothetical protein
VTVKKLLRSVLNFARRPGVRGSLVALAVYTLIAIFVLYPAPFRLNTLLAGFEGRDGWEHAWWLWFARRLLLQGRGLDDLYLLNHPLGLQHPYQWSLVSFSLIASFFSTFFPPAATYNLMVLSSFIFGGLAAYHLCRDLTGEHWPAVVGGAIFAFCPNRLGHALAGWLPQMTVYLFPWYALLLIRTLRRPTWRRSIGLGGDDLADPHCLLHDARHPSHRRRLSAAPQTGLLQGSPRFLLGAGFCNCSVGGIAISVACDWEAI